MYNCLLFLLLCIILTFQKKENCKIYVQLSAAHMRYMAYLPVVVKAWNRIGFCAIVIIAYHNITKNILLVANTVKKLNCLVYLLRLNNSISLHYSSKLARIYGFIKLLKIKMHRYFYISDVDMIPISKHFFQDMNKKFLTIKSFDKNGYGYGKNKGRWAMCYMVADQYVWYDLLKDDINNNNLSEIITEVIDLELKKGEDYFSDFVYIDEVYLRDKIRNWKYFKSKVLFHKRNYKNTRIGRDFSNFLLLNKNNSRIIDVHLPKLDSNISVKWTKRIIPLQKKLFNYIPYNMSYITSIFPNSF